MSKRGTIKPEVAFKELSAAKKAAKKSKKEKAMETQSAEAVVIQEPVTIVDVTPAVVPEPVVEAPVEKKPRVNKRPYIQFVTDCLAEGKYTRKELLDEILKRYEGVSKGGVQTFVTDLKNPRYCHFSPRMVVEKEGKLIFADVVIQNAEKAGIVQPATEPEPEATDQAE